MRHIKQINFKLKALLLFPEISSLAEKMSGWKKSLLSGLLLQVVWIFSPKIWGQHFLPLCKLFNDLANGADSVSQPRCLSVCLPVPPFCGFFNVFLLIYQCCKSNKSIVRRFLRQKLRKDIGPSPAARLPLPFCSPSAPLSLFVDNFCGYFLWSPLWTFFVNTFCEHFCGHFVDCFVDTFCSHFLWTLCVDTFCGHFLLILFVNTFCGHNILLFFLNHPPPSSAQTMGIPQP